MKEFQLKQLVKAVIKEMKEGDICSTCNGSGEGSADGTKCQTCKGSGVIKHGEEEDSDYPSMTSRGRYLSGDVDEDHGMGFGHNVSVPGDENTMNKPTVNEEDVTIPEKVKQLVKTVGSEKALDYIFQWVQARKVSLDQFKMLIYLLIRERK